MTTSITPNVSEFLKRIDPFDKLPSGVVDQLAATVLVKYLEKDEVIKFSALCTKRYLYLIRTGVVEQRSPNGELKARLGEEDQFGFTFLEPLVDSEDGYQAHAVEDSLLYMIPHEQLQLVTQTNPDFSDFFTSKSKDRLHKATRAVVAKEDKPFFFKAVGEVASENISIVTTTTSIKDVAKKMCGKRPSSCAVVMDNNDIVGMVTDRDMTRAVIAAEVDTSQPITAVMNRAPVVVQHEDKIIQAISLMLQYHIRCLPVVKDQQVVGLLTTTHLVHNHKTQSLFLIEKIRYADSIEALVALKQEKQYIFQALVESGVSAEVQGQVMSMIMDAFTRRIIQISEEKLGPPPCEYAWLVAGSHARNEVHMLSDQDSAIVLSDDAKESDRAYFLHLAMIVCNGLDTCGYPLCSGKYMAATPKWCQPISRWKQYYHKWVSNPEYNRLLSISVFLEIRAIHGNKEFVDTLHNTLHSAIHENQQFLSTLVRDAITTNPPLGIFNSLVLEKGGDHTNTLNIKKFALNLIIDLARIFCLAAGGSLTGTEERFRYAVEKGTLSQDSCDNIIEAYRFISQVRFRHQLMAAKEGRVPDNQISPDDFSSFERKHLKEAFKIIAQLQDVAKLKFLNVG